MDLHDIEEALRLGPPDEPDYVPGAYRQSSRRRWWLATAGILAGGMLVGAVLAIGLGIVRDPGTGNRADPAVIAAQLEGAWVSDEISFDRWVNALEAKGFDPSDIGEFLRHDPFEERVHYGLIFRAGKVTIQASYDGAPLGIQNFGSYHIDEDGNLQYVETTEPLPPVGDACHVVANVRIVGDRLTFDVLGFPGCGTYPRMAHTVFFDLLPYTRTGG